MYSDENVNNKWYKSGEHSVRTRIDYKHELIKYKQYISTTPKLMWLNEGKPECIKKIFQVVAPSYLK